MMYCESYCEEKGISTSELNEAQRTLYYIAENMKMEKSISEDGYKHFQMAIKAIEQEPCEDAISRQAAIDKVDRIVKVNHLNPDMVWFTPNGVKTLMEDLPSAERRGRWEDVEHAPNGLLYATCSVCGKRQTVECTNYCGNCGARLEAA